MTEGELYALLFLIGGLLIGLLLFFYFLFEYPKDKERERLRREKVLEDYEKEPEYLFTQAKVLAKEKKAYYVGVKLPKLVEEYSIRLLTEEGGERNYRVREEVYSRIEKGQEGTLVTVNGNFFDFGDGTDITKEENTQE